MGVIGMRQFVGGAIVLALLLAAGPAYGQAPYYAGKSIEFLVPTAVGGATDVLARFLAPYFEKHVAGNPSVRIRNMPGGGTLTGMNWFAANAKPDGTMVLASTVSSKFATILENPAARFDFRKMQLIAANGSGGVIYTSARTGIRRAAELPKAQGLVFGSIPQPGSELPVLLMFEVLGMSPRVVFGFESRGPIRLAFERGEVNLDFQALFVYNSLVLPMVREGKAVPLMTLGYINEQGQMVRDPAVPDLPTVYEVFQEIYGRKPDGLLRWKAYRAALAASGAYGRGWWVPAGTPPEALQALREAVTRMNRDPEFLQQAKTLMEGYPLLPGDRVEREVLRALRTTLDVTKYIKDVLREKYGQTV